MPEIQGYRFKEMTVDGEVITRDLILLPDRVVRNWRRQEGHRLSAADLQVVLEAKPEVLIVGTGAHGLVRVPRKTRRAVRAAGIELRIAPTGRAWRLYNELREHRRTAAAFHLAC